MNKKERFKIFCDQLIAAPAASSRDGALELVTDVMDQVEDAYSGLPRDNYGLRMHVYGFLPIYAWKSLDQDPCYWDDSAAKTHRIYLFNSGRIKISRLPESAVSVIVDKPGR